jgi:SpoVK/Ycf46/Vps4 family AAA+-type ATPase
LLLRLLPGSSASHSCASISEQYHGETERKLRESLKTADVMSPCVLWIDEIEKGIAGRGGETGTSQRVLGSFLTWMAERKSRVFVVATAASRARSQRAF